MSGWVISCRWWTEVAASASTNRHGWTIRSLTLIFAVREAIRTIPLEGQVLGIDVGWSTKRRTTGLALLQWTKEEVSWVFRRTTANLREREENLKNLVPQNTPLLGVAIDGPLAKNLTPVSGYRTADALFSLGAFQKRGSAAPTSPASKLHVHATRLAKLVVSLEELRYWTVAEASFPERISKKSIVEAHPVPFLSTLIDEERLPSVTRGRASDEFFCHLAKNGKLVLLLSGLLPGRSLRQDPSSVTNHDDRAALVCAITALCVVAGQYVTGGDSRDGRIVLTHQCWWGGSCTGTTPIRWAERELRKNLDAVREKGQLPNPKPRYAADVQVTCNGKPWMLASTQA